MPLTPQEKTEAVARVQSWAEGLLDWPGESSMTLMYLASRAKVIVDSSDGVDGCYLRLLGLADDAKRAARRDIRRSAANMFPDSDAPAEPSAASVAAQHLCKRLGIRWE